MGNSPMKSTDLEYDQTACENKPPSASLSPSKLSPEQRTKYDKQWEAHLLELHKYKSLHGDTSVPVKTATYGTLGKWCENQRLTYNKGKMSQERVDKLKSVGFVFESNVARSPKKKPSTEKMWMQRVEEFQAFVKEFGHGKVPGRYAANPGLGKWVENQRSAYNRGDLTDEKLNQLTSVGFVFEGTSTTKEPYRSVTYEHQWNTNFQSLIEYKTEFGDCAVPTKYAVNPTLGKWVENQKSAYRKGKLAEDRVNRLKDIGFSFGKRQRRKQSTKTVMT